MNNSQRHCLFSVDTGLFLPRVLPPLPELEACQHPTFEHNKQLGRYTCLTCRAAYMDEASEIADAHMTQGWIDNEFVKIVQYFQDLQKISEGLQSVYEDSETL